MDWRDICQIERDYICRLVIEHDDELGLSEDTPFQVNQYMTLADDFFHGGAVTPDDLLTARCEAIRLAEDRPDRDSNDAKVFDLVSRNLFDDPELDSAQDPIWFLPIHCLDQLQPSFAHDYVSYFLRRVRAEHPEFIIDPG